ncbi:MAG: hypothetical protein KJP18_01845 [Gemmatimonadetes bacterium]|nr:hypothetical protein [Gemmatimonadota bacterium]
MTAPSGSLAPPPPRGDVAPSGGGGSPGAGDPGGAPASNQHWSRRHPGRTRAVGYAISIAIHAVALLLYPAMTVRFGEVGTTIDPDASVDVEGIEVVNLQESASDQLDTPTDPSETLSPEAVLTRVPSVSVPGDQFAPFAPLPPESGGLSAAERLRPSTYEEDLWIPLVPDAITLTEGEILRSVIYDQLEAFNDSMAIRAAQAARGTDWTYTDDEGNRWGISPGKLHLGSITIPLPFSFGSPTGASDDAMDAQLMDREIRRAAGQLEADASVEERAAAIRARVDAERERARRSTTPDTSGGGGGGGGR